MPILNKIFGDPNEKEVQKLQKVAEAVNGMEKDLEKLSDDELKAKTSYFRDQLKSGKQWMTFCQKPLQLSEKPARELLASGLLIPKLWVVLFCMAVRLQK